MGERLCDERTGGRGGGGVGDRGAEGKGGGSVIGRGKRKERD